MALCHITGTVQLPDGTNAAGRMLVFSAIGRTVGVSGGSVVVPDSIAARVSPSGEIDLNLYTGKYTVNLTGQRYGGQVSFVIEVPDTADADISELI